MIHKTPSPSPGHVRVIFELPACIWADRIFLVGEFNDWNTAITPFAQGRDGVWRATVDLPVGQQYQFRYLVDGSWQTDYHADGWVHNNFGSQNSIVDITQPLEESSPPPSSLLREYLAERPQQSPADGPSFSPLMKLLEEANERSKLAG